MIENVFKGTSLSEPFQIDLIDFAGLFSDIGLAISSRHDCLSHLREVTDYPRIVLQAVTDHGVVVV